MDAFPPHTRAHAHVRVQGGRRGKGERDDYAKQMSDLVRDSRSSCMDNDEVTYNGNGPCIPSRRCRGSCANLRARKAKNIDVSKNCARSAGRCIQAFSCAHGCAHAYTCAQVLPAHVWDLPWYGWLWHG